MRDTQFITLKLRTGQFLCTYATSTDSEWKDWHEIEMFSLEDGSPQYESFPLGENYPCVGAGSYILIETPDPTEDEGQ